MSNIKVAYTAASGLSVTNLNGLATSATSGWSSGLITNDPAANLYLDTYVQITLSAVNTAPANSKAVYLYAYPLLDVTGTKYATTGALVSGAPNGTDAALMFPDITANPVNLPVIGVVPYTAQNVTINSSMFSVAAAFNGVLPPRFGLGLVNHSGMAISGAGVSVINVYNTVV